MTQEADKFKGAVPLLRKFQQHPFWTEKRTYSRAEAWIDFLFMARYSEKDEEVISRGEKIIIKYGYILTSVITLAERWSRSRTWVRNFLRTLKELEAIVVHRMDNRRTVIEIVNMLQVKRMLQQSGQQNGQQSVQQKSDRKTRKNKDNKENKENKLAEHTSYEVAIATRKTGTGTNFLLGLFANVNPSYKNIYANKTERASMERMVKEHGEEFLTKLLTKLPEIVAQPYAPRITTPLELERKMGQLKVFILQEQNKTKKGTIANV